MAVPPASGNRVEVSGGFGPVSFRVRGTEPQILFGRAAT
jgi:hypothetical protein